MQIKELNEQLHIILNEMSMYENPRKDFKDFRQYVLDNPKAKKTYFMFMDLKIPSDTIIHVNKRHTLNNEQWQNCLQAYQCGIILHQNNAKRTRYDGQAIKYVYKYNNSFVGMVIETLKNKDKMLTTVFMDNKNSLLNWVKQ